MISPDPLLCRTGSQCLSCHHFDADRDECGLMVSLREHFESERAPALEPTPWSSGYRPTAADTVPLFAWAADA